MQLWAFGSHMCGIAFIRCNVFAFAYEYWPRYPFLWSQLQTSSVSASNRFSFVHNLRNTRTSHTVNLLFLSNVGSWLKFMNDLLPFLKALFAFIHLSFIYSFLLHLLLKKSMGINNSWNRYQYRYGLLLPPLLSSPMLCGIMWIALEDTL